jgi:phosphatidylethanolamine/phosphatidyl-N-methylethanolamine N-methyltransferase
MPAFKFNNPQEAYEAAARELDTLIEAKVRRDDEVRFLRSWIEKPLHAGAVMPSGRLLARTMAQYVDVKSEGPVVELGPGTGAITNALIEHGIDQKRLVLVEYNPGFCALLRDRYPQAKVVQGDAYKLRDTLWNVLTVPASAVVSGLPLVTKPMLTRLKLIRDAFLALAPGAPFVQYTYSVAPPIPKSLPGVSTESSERIWMNLPPARVWVYRKASTSDDTNQTRKDQPEVTLPRPSNEVERPQLEGPTIPAKPAGDEGRIAASNGFNVYVQNLHQTLQQEPVLDGFDHPGLSLLIEAFEDYPDSATQWIQDQLTSPTRPSVAADILRLLCRFKPRTPSWRRDIVVAALESKSDEVRDAAIQAVETWREPELLAALRAHSDAAPWLADYATQVIRDLE